MKNIVLFTFILILCACAGKSISYRGPANELNLGISKSCMKILLEFESRAGANFFRAPDYDGKLRQLSQTFQYGKESKTFYETVIKKRSKKLSRSWFPGKEKLSDEQLFLKGQEALDNWYLTDEPLWLYDFFFHLKHANDEVFLHSLKVMNKETTQRLLHFLDWYEKKSIVNPYIGLVLRRKVSGGQSVEKVRDKLHNFLLFGTLENSSNSLFYISSIHKSSKINKVLIKEFVEIQNLSTPNFKIFLKNLSKKELKQRILQLDVIKKISPEIKYLMSGGDFGGPSVHDNFDFLRFRLKALYASRYGKKDIIIEQTKRIDPLVVGEEKKLLAVLNLINVIGSLDGVSEEFIGRLLILASTKNRDALLDKDIHANLVIKLRSKIDDVNELDELEGILIKSASDTLSPKSEHTDYIDVLRGWGWRLLPENDKAYLNPTYIKKYNLLRGQSGHGDAKAGLIDKGEDLLAEFHKSWSKIAPKNSKVISFALTGSDANNLFYDIALASARKKDKSVDHAEILMFSDLYVGARGRLSAQGKGPGEMNINNDLLITNPSTIYIDAEIPKDEIIRLERLENIALGEIREKLVNADRVIGGFFLEPMISGYQGVNFYRPEFLLRLRALADEFEIPIFADEVMNGGGRTGKFFSYLHYEGFEPDYVSFGKGIQSAGVAKVQREGRNLDEKIINPYTTIRNYEETLLKSTYTLNRIHEDELMQNASEVGEYVVNRIRSLTDESYRNQIRGKGMLLNIGVGPALKLFGRSRVLPPLTLTKEQSEAFFTNLE